MENLINTNFIEICVTSIVLTILSYVFQNSIRHHKSIVCGLLLSFSYITVLLSPMIIYVFLNTPDVLLIQIDLLGFAICLILKETMHFKEYKFYVITITIWIITLIYYASLDITNLWIIFLPNKTAMFYFQLIFLAIFYFGITGLTRCSLKMRIIGSLNVNALSVVV